MRVAQNNMKEHRKRNAHKSFMKGYESSEIINLVAEEEYPKAEIQPEYPVT